MILNLKSQEKGLLKLFGFWKEKKLDFSFSPKKRVHIYIQKIEVKFTLAEK